LKPGDVVVGVLVGAQETKVRPAIVIASATYLAERRDAVVGILTTKLPRTPGTTDYVLQAWQHTGLRAESCFRT
jgi:mRNA-degrading endonuclease toxin of MazEF toxin-antitoxin module